MIPMIYVDGHYHASIPKCRDYQFVFIAFLHVHEGGALYLGGESIGPHSHPGIRAAVQGVTDAGGFVLFSLGGYGQSADYQNIIDNYDAFSQNLTAAMDYYGISGIDLDLEPSNNDYSPFLGVCTQIANDFGSRGFVTAPPYEQDSFWLDLYQATIVDGWPNIFQYNIQTYGPPSPPDLAGWVHYFKKNGVSDAEALFGTGWSASECTPSGLTSQLDQQTPRSFSAFLWNYGLIPPGYTAADYAKAIIDASPASGQQQQLTERQRVLRDPRLFLQRRVKKAS